MLKRYRAPIHGSSEVPLTVPSCAPDHRTACWSIHSTSPSSRNTSLWRCLDVTQDGDLLVAAVTWTGDAGAGDAWILRLDGGGRVKWERRFGGRYWDRPTRISVLDDGMIVVGHTSSKGAGFEDAWLLRLDEEGRR